MKNDQTLNFNVAENQERCIYRRYYHQTKPYQCGNMIIQYFMYCRNYGWTRYKGIVYNLNKSEQSDAFLTLLLEEGFLKQEGNRYTILDSDYVGYVNIPRYYLLFELYSIKGIPLGQDECVKRDRAIRRRLRMLK